jgi:hypothetical protein
MSQTIDWSAWEDHVVDGEFCPPTKGSLPSDAVRRHRPPRNQELLVAKVPASVLRYDAASRTHRTTSRRMRAYSYNTLIEITDDGDAPLFDLKRVARRGDEWLAMWFAAISPRGRLGERLVVINADPDEERADDRIAIVFGGGMWMAEFRGERNRTAVRRAGFRFDPIERRWWTRDPRVAATFDERLRQKAVRQRRDMERM